MRNSGNLVTGKSIKNIAAGYITKDSIFVKAPFVNAAIFFRAIEKKYCIVLLTNSQSHDRYT